MNAPRAVPDPVSPALGLCFVAATVYLLDKILGPKENT